jgi:hypothetical protein
MLTFHYIICKTKRKERYHVKKLIFIDQKLEKTDDLNLTDNQLLKLKNELKESDYTEINDQTLNLDSFLKNFNIFCPVKD